MRTLLYLVLVAAFTGQLALGDYALRWAPLSGTSTGNAISVDLFLDETVTTNIANFGVRGASYKVDLGVGSVGTIDVPVENLDFDDINPPSTTGSSATVEQTSFLGVTSASNSLKIGTFLINPTIVGTGSLVASFLNPGNLGDFVVIGGGGDINLDPIIVFPAAPFTFEFTAVPEPTSILTAVSLASCAVYRRRRRKVSPEEALRVSRWKKAVAHHRKHYAARKLKTSKWFELGHFILGTQRKVSKRKSRRRSVLS